MSAVRIAAQSLLDVLERGNVNTVFSAADNLRIALADPASSTDSEDSVRIDFMEQHPELYLRSHKKRWSLIGFTNYEYPVFKTLREAIDEARSQS